MQGDNSDVALCPRCGNDSFNCRVVFDAQMECEECGWAVDIDDMESLTRTPQNDDGSKITKEWVDA